MSLRLAATLIMAALVAQSTPLVIPDQSDSLVVDIHLNINASKTVEKQELFADLSEHIIAKKRVHAPNHQLDSINGDMKITKIRKPYAPKGESLHSFRNTAFHRLRPTARPSAGALRSVYVPGFNFSAMTAEGEKLTLVAPKGRVNGINIDFDESPWQFTSHDNENTIWQNFTITGLAISYNDTEVTVADLTTEGDIVVSGENITFRVALTASAPNDGTCKLEVAVEWVETDLSLAYGRFGENTEALSEPGVEKGLSELVARTSGDEYGKNLTEMLKEFLDEKSLCEELQKSSADNFPHPFEVEKCRWYL